MVLQKQKDLLNKIIKMLANRQLRWHILRPALLIVVSLGVIGLAAYAQPVPKQAPVHQLAHKKSVSHHAVAPKPKPAPTPTPTPAPAPAPAPAPTKTSAPPSTPVPAIGTPKPEPVVTPSPSSSVSGLTPTASAPAPSSPTPAPSSQTTTGYLSTNWSGYLAANGTFTAVSASWTATMATGNGSTTSADSSWIGIGGVTSGDLIQVGTQNTITASGQVSTSAFYELLPNASQPVPGVTVAEGDNMTASITEISSGQWTVTITDNTDKQSWTATVSYTSSLSSAEWIEEDPSYVSGKLVPFDNFHEAVFTAGLATQNGASVTIAASTAQPVTMVDSNAQSIAIPSAIGSDGASFTVSP